MGDPRGELHRTMDARWPRAVVADPAFCFCQASGFPSSLLTQQPKVGLEEVRLQSSLPWCRLRRAGSPSHGDGLTCKTLSSNTEGFIATPWLSCSPFAVQSQLRGS